MATTENKRILKNSVSLYFRMFLMMGVSLYTSRIVLEALGVDDFGIFNVVAGLIVLIAFINQAMSGATQRFITFELGKEEKSRNLRKVFSACLNIHLALIILIVIFAETIGLWFVNTQMNFPEGRIDAVNWVYQLTIVNTIASIIRFPYQAVVTAYERMDFFAYTGILEAVAKLGLAFAIKFYTGDRLVLYTALILLTSVLISLWFYGFCRKNFSAISYCKVSDKPLYKEIVSFSGWAAFGSAASVGYQQGVNILINIFYGVTYNASVGIANQVNSAVTQFVSGFQQAVNPQLIKAEASHNSTRQLELIEKSAKFSFLIMGLLTYPIIMNIDYILSLWLGTVPPSTGIICSLILLGALVETISGPMWITMYATGKIKSYQIIISSILIINLPVDYILGKLNADVSTFFIVRIVIFFVALGYRLYTLRQTISLPVRKFSYRVLLPLTGIMALCTLFSYIIRMYVSASTTFTAFIWQSAIFLIFFVLISATLGTNREEKQYVKSFIRNKISAIK